MLPVFLLSILLFTFKKGSGDQRWNRWERGQEGEKPLCTPVPSDSIAGPLFKSLFLPFYLFTFKSLFFASGCSE